jgi:hypothetical protein
MLCENSLANAIIFINKALAKVINLRTYISSYVNCISINNKIIFKNYVYSKVKGNTRLTKAKL